MKKSREFVGLLESIELLEFIESLESIELLRFLELLELIGLLEFWVLGSGYWVLAPNR